MMFAALHFAEPEWLWFALLGPVALFLLQQYSARVRRRQLSRLAAPELLAKLTASHSPARRLIKEAALCCVLAGIGLALARPQWGEQTETSRTLGRDTLFVLDCSRSMLANDISPTRLDRARLAILDYVQTSGRGRVGLVAFAGQAFLQCPLTYDYSAFGDALVAVDERTIPVLGTDIGRALDEAARSMEKGDQQKLLVLITDGEDLEKGGIRKAEELAKEGVVVFTVGVGTPNGSEIQMMNEQGRPELLRNAKGEVVRSQLDEETLKAIANATRGQYYPLGPLGEGLTKVRLAAEDIDFSGGAPARRYGIDRFHVPVALVLALLVVESLIGTRRRLVPSAALAGAGLVLSLAGATPLMAAPTNAPGGVSTNSSGRAVESVPETPRDFFNAGARSLQEKKWKEAERFFETALASQQERLQPPSLYNLGHARFAQGAEDLKKGPPKQGVSAAGNRAGIAGRSAVRMADEALRSNELQQMLTAYMNGRGTRREIRSALKAVRKAMELYGNVLVKWQRSASDFKSAFEMDPDDLDARHNAEVVDRNIARLVDSIQEMQMMAQMLGQQQQELGEKMEELKGRIPQENMPPGAPGDEEEEEEGDKKPTPEEMRGQQEGPTKEGREITLSPEEAAYLLDSFRLDRERKLPMGQGKEGEPRVKDRATW